MNKQEITKVTFNIPDQELEAIRRVAKLKQITVTQAIRGAIGTELFCDENERNGCKILILEKNGMINQMIRRY